MLFMEVLGELDKNLQHSVQCVTHGKHLEDSCDVTRAFSSGRTSLACASHNRLEPLSLEVQNERVVQDFLLGPLVLLPSFY